MTSLCRLSCVKAFLLVVAVAAFCTSLSDRVVAKDPAPKPGSNDPNSSGYRGYTSEMTDRDKQVAAAKESIENIKPLGGGKADGDLFVIGTIVLKNRKATVDYVIKEGVQQTAEFMVDFAPGKSGGGVRELRIFGRAKTQPTADGMLAKAKSQSIEEQLGAFKLSVRGLKSPDDYFVVGTADMNCATLHADIRYEVYGGVKTTADFLIDFIFNRPENHKGEWHVFYRAPTEALAVDYRQQMRNWYDTLQAQRSQIAQIYKAKTTARC